MVNNDDLETILARALEETKGPDGRVNLSVGDFETYRHQTFQTEEMEGQRLPHTSGHAGEVQEKQED